MKKFIALLLAVMCLCLSLPAMAGSNPTGYSIGEMNTTDLYGNEVTGEIFSQYKLTYLNLWATWCPPCLNELPHIQAMHEDEDFAERGLNVMGLLWEDSQSTVKSAIKTLKDKGCTYTNIRIGDDQQIKDLVNNSGDGIPVSYLLNSKGEVIKFVVGGMTKAQMKSFIEQGFAMLEEPDPTAEPTTEPTAEPSAIPEPDEKLIEEKAVLGDANKDESVNTADATWVLKYAADMFKESDYSEENLSNADATLDGAVNTADATAILKHCAEIEPLAEKKTFTLTVNAGEEVMAKYRIETYAEYLRAPLEKNDIISGNETEYGMFVTTVNGITADADNNEWWCLTRDGGLEVFTGVDTTPIKNGSAFEFTLMVGYPEYKEIKLTVVDNEKNSSEFTLYTVSETLGNALLAYDLIDGYYTEYGLYVTTVNGVYADTEKQEWWCLTKNGGEIVETGVDSTPIANGDVFEFTFTVGW